MAITCTGCPRRAHILLVPLSAIGHFQPILHILYYLVDERYNDVVVTVIADKQRIAEVAKLQKRGDFEGLDLRLEEVFGEVPHFPDPCFSVRANAISEAMERDFEPVKRRLIRERTAFEAPTSIVGDMLFDWLADLAAELKISWFPLYSSGPSFATSVIELPNLISQRLSPYNPEKVNALISLPGLSFGRVRDMTGEIFEYSEYFALHFENMKRSTALLMNTAEELDEQAGSVIALRNRLLQMAKAEGFQAPRVLSIGPMIRMPGFTSSHEPVQKVAVETSSACLQWLEKQGKSSVLYICFGSHANITPKSMLELAHGVEASGVPFLWVLRVKHPHTVTSVLPPEFEARTKSSGRGFIEKSWAPQGQILQHPSVGGFLSHCGWNSTLEGICAGVPFITWPLNADQPLNARFVTDGVKIGIPISVKDTEDDYIVVSRDEVEKTIRTLMFGEKKRELWNNVQRLKKRTAESVTQGHSSYETLHSFLREITTVSPQIR
uniref:UDP-glycosyltransferase 2 n=1 Tax=Plagiochasma appendiculatum TaxID=157224 RepID=A0A7G4WF17_9MARC|nr:UDP-glycosyltransferase 2 [Plagiochasma appendiculatum]